MLKETERQSIRRGKEGVYINRVGYIHNRESVGRTETRNKAIERRTMGGRRTRDKSRENGTDENELVQGGHVLN